MSSLSPLQYCSLLVSLPSSISPSRFLPHTLTVPFSTFLSLLFSFSPSLHPLYLSPLHHSPFSPSFCPVKVGSAQTFFVCVHGSSRGLQLHGDGSRGRGEMREVRKMRGAKGMGRTHNIDQPIKSHTHTQPGSAASQGMTTESGAAERLR